MVIQINPSITVVFGHDRLCSHPGIAQKHKRRGCGCCAEAAIRTLHSHWRSHRDTGYLHANAVARLLHFFAVNTRGCGWDDTQAHAPQRNAKMRDHWILPHVTGDNGPPTIASQAVPSEGQGS